MDLKSKIKNFPDKPGIYLFYNTKKELIYVGKATSLKNRVRSYFVGARTTRPIEQMIHEVVDIKTIQTDSVLEAIILEANTIKKFQPKYNVDLKDDKSWNYIVITDDKFPRVELIREHELKRPTTPQPPFNKGGKKVRSLTPLGKGGRGGLLFGPYPGLKTKEMMRMLQKLFSISICEPGKPCRPCLYYQLGQCLGVCTGEISPSDYKKKVIKPLVQFLSGKKKSLLKNLVKEMKLASKNHEFEEAGRLRDQIKNLQKIQDIALLNKSFVSNHPDPTATSGHPSFVRRGQVRIEGYDISNLGSSGKVGSMVVFENNEPNKAEYRKFKIKTVVGQSDVDCLAEVIERRLKHVSPSYQEGVGGVAGVWALPQIILVDGGVLQVNKVVETIRINKFKISVVGIAKGPERKKNEFILGSKDREFVKWVSVNRELLIIVRDEAHRFAIKYQRSLRKIV